MKAILESTLGTLLFQNCAIKADVEALKAENAKLRDLLAKAETALKAAQPPAPPLDPVAKPPEAA